jgi:xylulose-5-phosphate/fructose-6-phosphate phosphoketolase
MTTIMGADHTKSSLSTQTLSREQVHQMNAYWRAANYLSVGQIYLYANELLREPLKLELWQMKVS